MALPLLLVTLAVTEPTSGISFATPRDTPCVLLPQEELGPGCPHADVEKIKKALGSPVWFYAMSEDGAVTLLARNVKMHDATSMSDEAIDDFVRGVGQAEPGTAFTPVRHGDGLHMLAEYGGLRVAIFSLEADLETQKKLGKPMIMSGAIIPIDGELVGLISTDTGKREGGQAVQDALRSLKAPRSLHPDTAMFGTGGDFRTGQMLGRFTGLLCCPLIIGVVIWLVVRRKKAPAS